MKRDPIDAAVPWFCLLMFLLGSGAVIKHHFWEPPPDRRAHQFLDRSKQLCVGMGGEPIRVRTAYFRCQFPDLDDLSAGR